MDHPKESMQREAGPEDTVVVSAEERAAGGLPPARAERAADIFRRLGYVVFEDLLPLDLVERARADYVVALGDKVARMGLRSVDDRSASERHGEVSLRFRPTGANHDVNRWNMHLPSRHPFLAPDIIANRVVLELLLAVFRDPVLFMIASDTPFPGSTFQSIHQDYPRFGVTLNVPLVDFTESNGPLEVWAGSHLPSLGAAFSKVEHWHSKEQLKSLVAAVPAKRCLLRRGSVLVRDHRLVHRGTHNAGPEPRPALSLWYKDPTTPAPHRAVANACQRVSLRARQRSRRDGAVADQQMLNKGNAAGRIVDELSYSDRDYRRRIPAEVWSGLPLEARHLLRFAEREGGPGEARRTVGADVATLATIAWTLLRPVRGT